MREESARLRSERLLGYLVIAAVSACSSGSAGPESSLDESGESGAVPADAASGSGGTNAAGGHSASAGGAAGSRAGGGGAGGAATGGASGGAGAGGTGGAFGPPGDKTFCQGRVVYDGEPGSHPVTTGSGFQVAGWPQATKAQDAAGGAAVGNQFLKVISDPAGTCCGTLYTSWTGWDKGPGQPIDLTSATSLELWIKVESGQYWNLMVEISDSAGTNSFTGADVHIADYIPGKNIDATWRQATVPLSALSTHGIDMSKISGLAFEGDRAVTFDVDQIVFCGAAP